MLRENVGLLVGAALVVAGALTVCITSGEAEPERMVMFEEGFEEGTGDWHTRGDGEYDIEKPNAHGGLMCARVTVPEGTEPQWQQYYRDFEPVKKGDEFHCTAWVRTEGITDGSGAYLALEYVGAQDARVGIDHNIISLTNGAKGWQELVVGGKAPEGTLKARINLVLNSHGTAYWDDIKVERISRLEPWPDLGNAERQITVDTQDIVQPNFGGVGFHVFHHTFDMTEDHFNEVVAKRWREINPSFARLNDSYTWDREMLDKVAAHILRFKGTGTEVYMTTWGPKECNTPEELADYAKTVADYLEYLKRDRACDNIKWYCMSNELTLGQWGALIDDLDRFKAYHQALHGEFAARDLDVGLLATDASPVQRWHSIEWATENMDDITAVYGGHHYINNHPLTDDRFYPWFLDKLEWGVGMARAKGKDFILGEFGTKQDGRVIDGVKMDACIYWDSPDEPMVAMQLCEAAIAAVNAGVYGMGNWTFMDFPDDYRETYKNKWGLFKWTGSDTSTRDHYYAYGLLTKFFRGPSTVYRTNCDDPFVRVTALRHNETGTYSVAVVNRYEGNVPFALALAGAEVDASFRKYVYDPANVPQNRFGDLQGPAGNVEMQGGVLRDSLGEGTVTVYTTLYDEEPPAPVRGVTVANQDDGSTRVSWEESTDPDLCYYRVFCSLDAGFTPSLDTQIASTIATHYAHTAPVEGPRHYKVVAVDQSGNAGATE